MRLHWILFFVTTNSQTKQTNRGVERGSEGGNKLLLRSSRSKNQKIWKTKHGRNSLSWCVSVCVCLSVCLCVFHYHHHHQHHHYSFCLYGDVFLFCVFFFQLLSLFSFVAFFSSCSKEKHFTRQFFFHLRRLIHTPVVPQKYYHYHYYYYYYYSLVCASVCV